MPQTLHNGHRHHTNGGGTYERGLGDVLGDVSTHAQQLVKGEIELVRQETMENIRGMAKWAAMGAAGAILALVSLVFLGHLIAQAIDTSLSTWLSYLIVTVLYLGLGLALGVAARKGLQEQQVKPADSIDQAKEDLEWVRNRI